MKFLQTKKLFYILPYLSILLLSTPNVSFAADIIIGAGTSINYYMPSQVYYNYSYTQQIYLQSEINAGGAVDIDEIHFYWNGNGARARIIRVYMAHTTKTVFTTTTDWVTSGLTQVYYGTYSLSASAGWYKITLDSPFSYDNSNNLVIAFDDNTGVWGGSLDGWYSTSTGSSYRGIYYYSDATNPNPLSPPAATNGMLYRPNVKLVVSTGTTTAPIAGSGDCLDFDGSGDYVLLASGGISSAPWTMEFWIKPNSPDDFDRIILQGSSANASRQLIAYWCSNKINFGHTTTGTVATPSIATTTITNGVWTHVAWTYNGSSHNVYVNGQSSSASTVGTNVGCSGNFYIGCRTGSQNYFDGSMDEVRTWTTARSQSDIEDNMYTALTGSESNLTRYYRFDEGSGSTVNDDAGTNNSGTITGATYAASEAWKNRSTDYDTPLTFSAGYDPNDDPLSFSITEAATRGVLVFDTVNNEITYFPDIGESGTDGFTFQVDDGSETDSYAMVVTVNSSGVNMSPVAGSGNCLEFDGADDYILLPNGSMVTSAWTLEFWVKPNSPGDAERIFLQGEDGYASRQIMAVWYTDHVEFRTSTSGSGGDPQIASGTIVDNNTAWTHVAWTYNGSTHKVYVNGVDSSGTVDASNVGVTGPSYIGTWDATGSKCFTGCIDEVRLWSDDLTQAEIADSMYVALSGSEANLVGYWRMDESSGDYARDYSGDDNHGLLKNMTDGDWVASTAWKDRITYASVDLTHSAGYDPEGSGVTVSGSSSPTQGSYAFNSTNRTVTYTPPGSAGGPHTYTYQIADSKDRASDTYQMSVTVLAPDALTISSHTPTKLQQSISAGSNIAVTFSVNVDGATVDATSFYVNGDVNGLIAGAFSGGGTNTITFNPTSDFTAGEVVTVTLTTAIKSTGAGALDDDYMWQFVVVSSEGTQAFSANTISTAANGALSVYAADVDSDGEMDALSASETDDKIAWYENDGSETFAVGDAHTISTGADQARSVYAADVDGDGDMDVLSASPGTPDEIAWYDNNGSETFTEYIISTAADGASSVYAADVDGDGDMDVLSASSGDDEIAWYENNGSQTFSRHIISSAADGAKSVYAADVDSDGDMDVLSASETDDKIAWYENDGSETFAVGDAHTISTEADGAQSVYAADVDSDGDMDVLSASETDDKIAWYENNGSETFTRYNISTAADGAQSVYAADMDGDGDVDVLSASDGSATDEIAWYENNGSESFTEHIISTAANGAKSVYAADVDGDGDLDVLSASFDDDKIAWYENPSLTSENYNNWAYSQSIYINTTSTGADVSGDVSDFPLLIRLTTNELNFDQCKTDGTDLRFSKSDGTHLYYERERWDNTNDLAEFWVNVPTVTGNNSTQYIKMYWGKSNAVDSSNSEAVFETTNDFEGVWHLHGTDYSDATANSNDASNSGSDDASGNIAYCQDFNGLTDYMNAGSDASLDNINTLTMSAWIYADGWGESNFGRIFDKGAYLIFLISNSVYLQTFGIDRLRSGTDTQYRGAVGTFGLGQWYYVTAVMNGNTNSDLYKDGNEISYANEESGTLTLTSDASASLYIGNRSATDRTFNGKIDELRIESSCRSAYWIKLCYETQKQDQITVTFPENYHDWNYSMDFTLNTTSTGANVLGNVLEFPLLIRLDEDVIDFNQAETDGSDIRFSKPDGTTPLFFERERWDNTNDLAEFWVLLDTAYGDNPTQYITMYWGKSGADDKSNPEVVFDTDNDFAAVWHLNEDATDEQSSATHYDATSNNNDGSQTGNNDIAGAIAKAQYFDGTNDVIRIDNSSGSSHSLDFTQGPFTISTWFYSGDGSGTFVGKRDGTTLDQYQFFVEPTKGDAPMFRAAQEDGYTTETISWNTWYYCVVVVNASENPEIYLDAESTTWNDNTGSRPYTFTHRAVDVSIGARWETCPTTGFQFEGIIDEVCISDAARSTDWIKLCYETQKPDQNSVNPDTANVAPVAGSGNALEFDGTDDYTSIECGTVAQSPITIGTQTYTGQYLPTEAYYDYSYTQQIYRQSEIDAGAAITIDSIQFYWNGNNSYTRDITVYMAHTSSSTLSNWVSSGSLTQVYSGNYSLTSTAGWHTIILDSPFAYNNSDNLLVAFDDNTGSYYPSSTQEFYCTYLGAYRSIRKYQDYTDITVSSPGTGTLSTYRANMRLRFVPGSGGTSDFNITNLLTVEAWIKVAAFDKDYQTIVAKGDMWKLYRNNNTDYLRFLCAGLTTNTTVNGDINVNDGEWHHVAGVYDGSKIYLYVDGVEDNSEIATGSISTNDANFYIGENATSTGRQWEGCIDEVRVWNEGRTATEIVDNMYKPLEGDETNLVGYWRMDASSGTTLKDYSSNANNATLENMTDPDDWVESNAWTYRSVDSDTTLTIDAGYDEDGDDIEIAEVNAPEGGNLSFDNDNVQLTYTPSVEDITDTFSYELSDAAFKDTFEVIVAVAGEDIHLLPLTVVHNIGMGAADTCSISTDKWRIAFDEAEGGGIRWLSDESRRGVTNQLDDNMFYIRVDGTNSHAVSGVLSQLDSNSLYCKLRQSFTINSHTWDVDYTVYGCGRAFVRVETEALYEDYTSSSGLQFRVKSDVTNKGYYKENSTASQCNYILHSDQASSRFDILLALYEDWSQASGFTTTAYKYYGIKDSDWELAAGNKQVWEFMLDFGHKKWNDTSGVGCHVDDYRFDDELDSLELLSGTYRMEKAWEEWILAHWTFDNVPVFEEPGMGARPVPASFMAPHANQQVSAAPLRAPYAKQAPASLKAPYAKQAPASLKINDEPLHPAEVQINQPGALYYGLDDGDTAYDHSGTGHHGVLKGGTWATGKWNGGLTLNGTTDSVAITNAADFDGPMVFTIMAWIKKTGTSEDNALIFGKHEPAAREGYKLTCEWDKLRFTLYNHSLTGNTSLGTGWRHVAVSFNYHTRWLKLFVDGKPDAIAVVTPSIITSTVKASIGNDFSGTIDDVRFYHKEISEETIRAISQNGYRVDEGNYMLRATNNNTMHFNIDGSIAQPLRFPIFQIANYWAATLPEAVYYDKDRQTITTDYLVTLDDANNLLTIGFDNKVTASDLYIYVDDNDSSGVNMIDPMKKIYFGTSNDTVYVKNLSGTTFGSAGSNEFYLSWKMSNASNTKDGEIHEFKSSEISANSAITDAANTIYTGADYTLSGYAFTCNAQEAASYSEVKETPSYTVIENNDVRVRLQIDERVVDDTQGFDIVSIWTIYPTGQIFRYDTIYDVDYNITSQRIRFYQKYENVSNYDDDANCRGGIYGGSNIHDYAVCLAGSANKNGSTDLIAGAADEVAYYAEDPPRDGIYFSAETDLTATDATFKYAFYLDIQNNAMDDAYIIAVCDGVQSIDYNSADFTGGTGWWVDSTEGDLNGDGFNEAEGAYVMRADDNAVNFLLETTNGDRYYPALRILNYTVKAKPEYIYYYTSTDTTALVDGWGYNGYVNTTDNEFVMQINKVFSEDTKIWISYDDDLAVVMSDFYAKAGDGKDTLFWRTESEVDNLGFFLYRRISREFLDSLSGAIDSMTGDSLLDNAGVLLKQGKIGYADTAWVSLTKDIIPSAYSPGDIPGIPRDYKKIDRDVENDVLYEYRLVAIDKDRTEDEFGPIQVTPRIILPKKFFLFHNFPNPARFYTNFRFDLPAKSKVALYVYNLQGRLVARIIKPHKYMKPGFHRLRWKCTDEHGRKLASGPYVYRFVATRASKRKYAKNRMMILIK